ncbi:MAG: sigma-70 family RNA polymerase sigma factor [Oscillospiraceae bacterium]|nr:sigma-70 family RNA polymerase sigma factor [Oscillospiraceae bacterium]
MYSSIQGMSVEIGGKAMSRAGSDFNSSDFCELDSLDDNGLIDFSRRNASSSLGKRAVSTLILRYIPLVRKRANGYARDYAEPEDLAQEGFLSFLNAVDSFDPSRGAKFSSFADVCVTNGIKNAALKLKKNAGESRGSELEESGETISSPENIWFEKEKMLGVYGEIESLLTKREWDIFRLYLVGLSYREIADRLDIPVKSVNNAVFRVRKKLRALFSPDNADI